MVPGGVAWRPQGQAGGSWRGVAVRRQNGQIGQQCGRPTRGEVARDVWGGGGCSLIARLMHRTAHAEAAVTGERRVWRRESSTATRAIARRRVPATAAAAWRG